MSHEECSRSSVKAREERLLPRAMLTLPCLISHCLSKVSFVALLKDSVGMIVLMDQPFLGGEIEHCGKPRINFDLVTYTNKGKVAGIATVSFLHEALQFGLTLMDNRQRYIRISLRSAISALNLALFLSAVSP